MRKKIIGIFTIITLSAGIQVANADCPYQIDPCYSSNLSNCCLDPCCEDWLCPQKLENYFCQINLNECQKSQARNAVLQFTCNTQCLRNKRCKCESKRDCRNYRKALRNLDCNMKNIMTKCQKSDYKYVRKEVKNQVSCCHHCLINPFVWCQYNCR